MKALIQIIGAPVACSGKIKDSWRETAAWISERLIGQFGDSVKVEYYDLFDPACPSLPDDAQIPIVLINSKCFSSGGKLSHPAIRKYLETFAK